VNYLYSGEMIIYQKMHPTVYLNFYVFFFIHVNLNPIFTKNKKKCKGEKGEKHLLCEENRRKVFYYF
jgi:hypothetical protein